MQNVPRGRGRQPGLTRLLVGFLERGFPFGLGTDETRRSPGTRLGQIYLSDETLKLGPLIARPKQPQLKESR